MYISQTTYTFPTTGHNAFPSIAFVGGVLIATWRRASNHTIYDGQAMLSRSEDLGRTWSKPVCIFSEPGYDWSSVGMMEFNGSVLITLARRLPSSGIFETWVSWSDDNGLTWDNPTYVAPKYPAGPAVFTGEAILQSVYIGGVGIYASTNGGASWSFRSQITTNDSMNETCIRRDSEGKLIALIRNAETNNQLATSVDNGNTWTTPWARWGNGGYPNWIIMNKGRSVCTYRAMPNFQDLELRWSDQYWENAEIYLTEQLVETAPYRSVYSDMVEISPNIIAHISAIEWNPTSKAKVRFRYITDGAYLTPHGEITT